MVCHFSSKISNFVWSISQISDKCYVCCIRKMGCEKQGYFTLVCITHFFEELILVLISIKLYMLSCVDQNILLCCQDEWRTGLKALRADSISKLKKAFPELVQEVSLSPKI